MQPACSRLLLLLPQLPLSAFKYCFGCLLAALLCIRLVCKSCSCTAKTMSHTAQPHVCLSLRSVHRLCLVCVACRMCVSVRARAFAFRFLISVYSFFVVIVFLACFGILSAAGTRVVDKSNDNNNNNRAICSNHKCDILNNNNDYSCN